MTGQKKTKHTDTFSMAIEKLAELEHIIDERLYESGIEDETPNEFIEEVCYRFFNSLPQHCFIERNQVEEYVLIMLKKKLDTDYDLNLFRLRFLPLNYNQDKDH